MGLKVTRFGPKYARSQIIATHATTLRKEKNFYHPQSIFFSLERHYIKSH